MISIMNNVMKNLPWADRYGTSASLHFWILKKSIIFFWEKPTNETKRMRKGIRTHWQSKNYTPKEIHSKWRRKKKDTRSKSRINKFESILTSYSSLARAFGAKPGSNRDPNNDRTYTFHMKSLIAFVTQQQLIIPVAGATFLAPNVVVIVPFENHILCLGHYLRHWLQLPRWRWHRGGSVRGVGATERGTAADKSLGGGVGWGESWSHEEEDGLAIARIGRG